MIPVPTNVPPALAGTDGTVHKEDGRVAPTIVSKLPSARIQSNHWCALRVARRLVTRYGCVIARHRALQQKAKHVSEVNGVRYVTNPFAWLYWDLVAIDTAKIPEPVRAPVECVA